MDEPITSDAAAMNRRSLLEQLAIIRSLSRKQSSADDAATAAATATARNRNVVEGRVKEGVRVINDQMAAVSTELLLTVMSDMMLLRLLDGLGLEEGGAVPSSDASSDQQLMLMDAAATAATAEKEKKKRAAAAAKKKRYKRNKAAAKHKNKKTNLNLMPWLGGGIISLIMMVAFSSMTTVVFPLSLIHQSDGSGEGQASPALPPSASKKTLPQKDHRSNDAASTSPDIISPLPAAVLPPVFSPTAASVSASDRRMQAGADSDNTANPTTVCLDTPNWKNAVDDGCDWYEDEDEPGCPEYGWQYEFEGEMGLAALNCCYCGGGSHTLPPTISPNSAIPTKFCVDTPFTFDGNGCDWYEKNEEPGCPDTKKNLGDMASPVLHCCYCGGGSHTLPPTISPKPSSSPTSSANPTKFCLDTPNWKDDEGDGCDWWEDNDEPGCPEYGWITGDMGYAKNNCCYCGGGSHTLSPTTFTGSPTKSAVPSSSPTLCTDTEDWYDYSGNDCGWYEAMDVPGCPRYGYLHSLEYDDDDDYYYSDRLAMHNCCHCKNTIDSTPASVSES